MNGGKKFEQQWRISAQNDGLFFLRLADSDLSFNPNKEFRSRFTQKSPFDCIVFMNGTLFCLELKHTIYKSFSFQRTPEDSDGLIHAHQINSLTNCSQYDGVIAGFVFNFRTEDPLDEDTYFMDIRNFNNFSVNTGKKSINKLDIINNGGIIIPSIKKRTLFVYGVKEGLEKVLTI